MQLAVRWFLLLGLSFILMLLPWPYFIAVMLPPWCLFLLFYLLVVSKAPWAWAAILFVGLMLDVMQGSLLGTHVLALTLGLWVTKLDAKLYYKPAIDRQMIWVGSVFLVYQVTLFTLNAVLFSVLGWQLILPMCLSVILSVVLWPWGALCLDGVFKTLKPVSMPARILE